MNLGYHSSFRWYSFWEVYNPINSFWLPTATGKFYPDFIIEFDNGKTVVAEYKGKVYIPEYEITKKPIGEAWGMLSDTYEFISLYATNYMTNLSKI